MAERGVSGRSERRAREPRPAGTIGAMSAPAPTRRRALLLVGSVALAPGLACGDRDERPRGGTSRLTGRRRPVVTLEQYRRLELGMSYDEVVAIIGVHGMEDGGSAGGKVRGYSWRNSDGSSVQLVFEGDALIDRDHEGLE